jgi:hypothetical protein
MRKLIAILCLCLSAFIRCDAAVAQTSKAHPQKTTGASKAKHTPLILVNGRFYNGDITRLHPSDIQTVKVLKYESAKTHYGSLATDGVLFIETKQRLYKDTTDRIDSVVINKHPLFVVDGIPLNSRPTAVLPKNIAEIIAIKNMEREGVYVNHPGDGAIVIITRKGAIKRYQKMLSDFSPGYKAYIAANNGDKDLLFVLRDGSIAKGESDALLKEMITLQGADIKSVAFNKRTANAAGWKPASVNIELNNKN